MAFQNLGVPVCPYVSFINSSNRLSLAGLLTSYNIKTRTFQQPFMDSYHSSEQSIFGSCLTFHVGKRLVNVDLIYAVSNCASALLPSHPATKTVCVNYYKKNVLSLINLITIQLVKLHRQKKKKDKIITDSFLKEATLYAQKEVICFTTLKYIVN